MSITVGSRFAVVDGRDATGWGWSVERGVGDGDGFARREHGAKTLEEALRGVRGKIGS
ncbi:hypothetical protein [Streptomyces katrae]|uniref:hypothetical protein n=1 Tax=Streptomyces katrae TaxID=68223 RepID=UPI000AEA9AC3|nr:hypothetical protein [Streptomyces katrae]